MVHAASIHVLTPGSAAYAIVKVGAIGGLIAPRLVMARRDRVRREQEAEPTAPPQPERHVLPHPVSRKKQRRRRR